MDERGSFVWYDLLTNDVAGAKAFYRAVIGYGLEPFEGSYEMWTTPGSGRPIGGVMPLPEEAKAMGAPPNWMGYVAVPNVDESLTQVVALGGSVLSPAFDMPNVGRMAVIADPQRGAIALFQPAHAGGGYTGDYKVGDVAWKELMADDWRSVWSFYEKLFGWTKGELMEGEGMPGGYQLFNVGDKMVGGMANRPEMMPVSAWLYYIWVEGLDAALDRVKAEGGQLLHGPMPVPGDQWVAQCMDPQGAAFALHSATR